MTCIGFNPRGNMYTFLSAIRKTIASTRGFSLDHESSKEL